MIESLVGVCFFGLIWFILFFFKRSLRKEMIVMSLFAALLGPLSEFFYVRDYWRPTYIFSFLGVGVEDVLFAFFIGGIAAISCELFWDRSAKKEKRESKWVILLGVIGLVILMILNFVLKINSIYASSLALLGVGGIVLLKRRDLVKNALISGIVVLLVMFLFYLCFISIFPKIIQEWWLLDNISGILVFGMPIEELLWGFSWGFMYSPFYKFWKGL